MKRTQIYLDEGQEAQLGQLAAEAGVTRSTLIREAIDAFLQGPRNSLAGIARFHAALEAVERHPVSLPDGRRYVEELRHLDLVRQDELERHLKA